MRIAIIGAGISGLTLAYFIQKTAPNEHQITLIESERLGGSLQTENVENCLLEMGFHDFYLDSPLFQSLFKEIGLSLTPIKSDFEKIFVSKEAQLMRAHPSFEKMSKTPVLFFTEKIKMAKAMKKKYSFWPSMSVDEAFKSVFGKNAADYIASPLIRYLFHSEAEDIELASAFPNLYAYLEQGKTIMDSYQRVQDDKRKLHYEAPEVVDFDVKQNQIGRFTPTKGLSEFSKKLSIYLKKNGVGIELCKVQNIRLQNQKYILQSRNKNFDDYDSVVLATPPHQTAKFLRSFNKGMSVLLSKLKLSYTSSVYHAWSPKVFSMGGAGMFFPRAEKMPYLFILLFSNLYPTKVAPNIFLTQTCLGGDHTIFDDSDLVKLSLDSMKRKFKIKSDPLWNKVYRSRGLPKYTSGHSEWKSKIAEMTQQYPKLYLHGKAFQGLQIEQLMEASYLLAKEIST